MDEHFFIVHDNYIGNIGDNTVLFDRACNIYANWIDSIPSAGLKNDRRITLEVMQRNSSHGKVLQSINGFTIKKLRKLDLGI